MTIPDSIVSLDCTSRIACKNFSSRSLAVEYAIDYKRSSLLDGKTFCLCQCTIMSTASIGYLSSSPQCSCDVFSLQKLSVFLFDAPRIQESRSQRVHWVQRERLRFNVPWVGVLQRYFEKPRQRSAVNIDLTWSSDWNDVMELPQRFYIS